VCVEPEMLVGLDASGDNKTGNFFPVIFFVSNICFSGFLCYNIWEQGEWQLLKGVFYAR